MEKERKDRDPVAATRPEEERGDAWEPPVEGPVPEPSVPPEKPRDAFQPPPRKPEHPKPVEPAKPTGPRRRVAADLTNEEVLALARRLLRAVVLRVPMDDISGAQSLEFAGFTGRKGGGILLHHKNMKRLGGADLDIDSAFVYFGMPDATHKMLERNRDNQEKMLNNPGLKYADRLFASRTSNRPSA